MTFEELFLKYVYRQPDYQDIIDAIYYLEEGEKYIIKFGKECKMLESDIAEFLKMRMNEPFLFFQHTILLKSIEIERDATFITIIKTKDMTNKVKKLKDVDIKDYLIQLAGGTSWADSGMPYAFGEPMKKRKKVLFFLNNSKEGKKFREYIERQKSEGILEQSIWRETAKHHFSNFCKEIQGLDLSKYGFNHGENNN